MQGYFTQQGMQLAAKLAAGTALEITRIEAGAGETPASASSLSQLRQALAVNSPGQRGNTAVIPATLTAAGAGEDYTLTELGVYARDPEKGEILYKIYRLDEPVDISAGSRLVLRFYLEETVSEALNVTVTCSPAGLVTEEDFSPVQKRVNAAAVQSRYVQMEASALQDYLDSLPRLVTEELNICVSGSVDSPVTLSGFYGCGSIMVYGTEEAPFTVQAGMTVSDCSARVTLFRVSFAATGLCQNDLTIQNSGPVIVSHCGFTGDGTNRAAYIGDGSQAAFLYSSFSNAQYVFLMGGNSIVSCYGNAEGGFENNTYGALLSGGGILILGGTVPNTLGGAANIKNGGIIVSAPGTLL